MTTVNTYLTFNGTCEAAFNFYQSVFGGTFSYFGKFKDMPEDPNCKVSDEDKEKVMHVSLPISKETVLMGSDTGGEWAPSFKQGNNFSISINTDSKAEADKLFNALSENGTVTMPMEETFWGAYFGMFIDQFGIQWMVNYDDPSKTQH
jgi:PhnB protein